MEKVRLGIVGLGRMGLTHYSIINTHPDVEVVAVADTSTLMLDMLKKFFPSLRIYKDYTDLLNDGEVDALIVCTPSFLHYPVCKLAAEKGVSVFCEKPFTTSVSEASELGELFEFKGLVNQVGYVYRFEPVFRKVKEMLDENIIGRITHVNAQFLSSTIVKYKPSKGWRSKRENGGGATYEMGSHLFDILEFFFGKPEKLIGSDINTVYSEDVEDTCDAVIRYAKNLTANIHVNWSDYTYRKPMMKIEIQGVKGKIVADLYGYKLYLREPDLEHGMSAGWTTVPMNLIPDSAQFYVRGTSFSNQLYAFADSVLGRISTRGCPFRSAADTQEVIHEIFDNANK